LAISLAYPNGEEGGNNFLVQMISTCFRYTYSKEEGGLHSVVIFLFLRKTEIYWFRILKETKAGKEHSYFSF
jgi:hypothetical protein